MRILHISNYYMEGFGYQENWLPFHQGRLGHDVQILTSNRWFPLPDYERLFRPKYGSRIRKAGVSEDKGIPIVRMKPYFEIRSRAVTVIPVADYLREFEPEVIHVHGATNFNVFSVLRYARSANAKVFIDCHQDHLVTREQSIANRINYRFWRAFLKNTDSNIARYLPISRASLDFLSRNLGVPPSRCTISPLGVDTSDKSFSQEGSDEFRCRNDLQGYTIIVNAGKQYRDKNILFILEIYRALLSNADAGKLALVLVGEATGEYDAEIRKTIEEICEKDEDARILRLPFLPNKDLNAVYSAADLGVWPGVASNTIQEAMACDVVVALLDTGITSHLVVDEALRIADLDTKQVAKDLGSVLFHRERFERLKELTARRIEEFTWSSIARDTIRIYEESCPVEFAND